MHPRRQLDPTCSVVGVRGLGCGIGGGNVELGTACVDDNPRRLRSLCIGRQREDLGLVFAGVDADVWKVPEVDARLANVGATSDEPRSTVLLGVGRRITDE